MNNKVKLLDSGYAHEALDRTHTILVMIDELLSRHKGVTDMNLQDDVEDISERLGNLYQKIGEHWD